MPPIQIYLGVIVNDSEFMINPKKRVTAQVMPLRTHVGKDHGINVNIANALIN